jgi:hypothetical protein
MGVGGWDFGKQLIDLGHSILHRGAVHMAFHTIAYITDRYKILPHRAGMSWTGFKSYLCS